MRRRRKPSNNKTKGTVGKKDTGIQVKSDAVASAPTNTEKESYMSAPSGRNPLPEMVRFHEVRQMNEVNGMHQGDIRIAVLIDADNISYRNIRSILEEIAKYGIPTIKRVYGDWTKPTVEGWKSLLLENAIIPVQQYSYTTGKNATDSAMIIDAMDILYSGRVGGFCIVSSDSDFTRLATRLREAGMRVYGVGEQKTPVPFIAACDKFTYVEVISGRLQTPEPQTAGRSKKEKETKPSAQKSPIRKLEQSMLDIIAQSIEDLADEDGWSFLGDVGTLILKKMPDFDPRNYGYSKLTPLFKNLKQFEVDERVTGNHGIKHNYVRNRK